MADIFDYILWRGDLTFDKDPLNAVDALIFSCLAYVQYGARVEAEPQTPISLREAAEEFFHLEDHETRSRILRDQELLQAAAASRRFGNTRICMYRDVLLPEQETQFAAMTFLLEDGSMFLSFRGTDNSLVGWKEDFNMTFQQTVPAQRLALQYAREVAWTHQRPMYLGGHSKGGNLAVFAAARLSPMLQNAVKLVFNNDGPGFTKYMIGDPGYLAMVPRIKTYIPQTSVIGMLLEHEEPYLVIRSQSVGLMQHDPYSWDVMGSGFIPVEEVTEASMFVDSTLKIWFSSMSNRERGQLVDVLFSLLSEGGVDNVQRMIQLKNLKNYIKVLSTDENIRRVLSSEFQGLLDAIRQTRMRFEGQKMLSEKNTPDGTP